MSDSLLRHVFALAILVPVMVATPRHIEASDVPPHLERRFRDAVQPFLRDYCLGCHGKEKPRAGLDLSSYPSVEAVAGDHRRWEAVVEQLRAGAMPPAKAKSQPDAKRKQALMDWAREVRTYEAKRTAGDPGPVPARRLSNAEYDCTVRDLTGVDLRPAREFPVDPTNESGFDNSAESLSMSPDLLKKYIEAARRVADHLVLKPDGFTFAPHTVVADTDRDKYATRRIIDFYKRQPIDLADYFLAAWRFKHRRDGVKLADVAAEVKISPKYLATIWATLTEATEEVGPVAVLQQMWRELPATADAARPGCEALRDWVVKLRKRLVPEVKNLTAPGLNNGSQTLVMWKNRQFVANRRRYAGGALTIKDLPQLTVPTDKATADRYEATFRRFCSIFPDAFFVSERARVYLDPKAELMNAGRLLSAGFHSMTGYFRDDGPLYDLILDREGQRELDRLWREFDFVTGAPMRQHTSFIWFERTDSTFMRDPEFDVFRAEDKDSTSDVKIRELARVYLDKARRRGASETALEAMETHFKTISASIRVVEEDRRKAEPTHLKALQEFAERAYRRPLSKSERDDVVAFYRALREKEGLGHEDAVRDTVVSVLMSPYFCFRVDRTIGASSAIEPLPGHALANRLSYFLWSSMPDKELLSQAENLRQPDTLISQARRMLKDPRARGLATEFAGNWLDFRRFEGHNAVDRTRFPAFTEDLRAAMFEEPVTFFLDVAREDRSVLDFLEAKYTWVNPVLARHYGMPVPKADEWVRVDHADRHGRGGLLPMAVFLTQNSPGLRTSPVKRGYWVVRRLLGEHIPAPPPEVPELPADEAKLGERTLRETLAMHRQHKSCAACHDRFDSVGLVFEGYGPIGERRTKDLGGRAIDARATFPDGSEGADLEGLQAYLRAKRQTEFVDNLCRKLLAYALGRNLRPGDDEAIEAMKAKLIADRYRFGSLVVSIITSKQFLNRGGRVPYDR